jgi:hypothetical protein
MTKQWFQFYKMNKIVAYLILLFIAFACKNDAPKFDIKNFPKDKLGEELEILRDNDNTIVGYKTHQNIYKRSRYLLALTF